MIGIKIGRIGNVYIFIIVDIVDFGRRREGILVISDIIGQPGIRRVMIIILSSGIGQPRGKECCAGFHGQAAIVSYGVDGIDDTERQMSLFFLKGEIACLLHPVCKMAAVFQRKPGVVALVEGILVGPV